MKRSLLTLLSLAVTSQAQQQVSFKSRLSGGFVKAALAVWSVSCLVYLVFTILLIVILVQRRYADSRRPFSPLFLSIFFALVNACASIAMTLMKGLIEDGTPPRFYNSLTSTATFCQYWTPPFLFLAIVYVLHDRHTAIFGLRDGRGEKKFPALPTGPNRLPHHKVFSVTHIILISTMSLLGFVATIVLNIIRRHEDRETVITVDESDTRKVLYNALYYTYCAVWGITTIDVVLLSAVVRKVVQQVHHTDWISLIVLYQVSPLYACYVLGGIAFTIAYSPVGVKQTDDKLMEKVEFAKSVVQNVFLMGVSMLLVKIGWSGELPQPPPSVIADDHVPQVQAQHQHEHA